MRLAEIKKKYRNQWVLVEFSKLDRIFELKTARSSRMLPTKKTFIKLCFKLAARTYPSNTAANYLKIWW